MSNSHSEPKRLDYLKRIALASLDNWDIPSDASVSLISLSENAMFLVQYGNEKWVLRVHRNGYHSENAVRSELAWMNSLREDAGLETPVALPGGNKSNVQFVSIDSSEEPRMVVLFEFISGKQPSENDLHDAFRYLGAIAARMHEHSRRWVRPEYFERQIWDYEGAFGASPNWGHWRVGFDSDISGIEVVEAAEALMRERLERFGKSPHRFGLIHSDLRLANLLVEDGKTKVLDFDDSGIGWYLYDVASCMTFIEDHEDIENILASWIDGYRTVCPLSDQEIDEIPTLMMFRRLVIMGWGGSHPDTDLANQMAADGYTARTVQLARKYLARN